MKSHPIPWSVFYSNDDGHEDDPSWVSILDADGDEVTASDAMSGAKGRAAAELIVRLVNAKPEIVAALEAAEQTMFDAGYGATDYNRDRLSGALRLVRSALEKVRP